MPGRLRTAIVSTSLVVGCAAPAILGGQVSRPLPIVTRTTPTSEATLFRKPDIILMTRVVQRCDAEMHDDVSGGYGPPRPIVRSFLGIFAEPLLLNKRAADDPDLSSGDGFYFQPLSEATTLTLGQTYVLLLDAIKYFPPGAHYTVSHAQIGFEVVHQPGGDRVRPIIRGGELDAYDGRLLADVVKEIQTKK